MAELNMDSHTRQVNRPMKEVPGKSLLTHLPRASLPCSGAQPLPVPAMGPLAVSHLSVPALAGQSCWILLEGAVLHSGLGH
jgi:hypothetical protein